MENPRLSQPLPPLHSLFRFSTKEPYGSLLNLSASIRPVAQALVDNGSLQTDVVSLAADAPGRIHADSITALGIVIKVLNLEGGICAPADAAALVADIVWAARLPAPMMLPSSAIQAVPTATCVAL